ncbi:peptide ligase PGM1-related protein [Paraburkholderia sp. BR14374]|uniref:preATP grasp domain-containing protein n=1 Tax=Paraburkholderia sp. BR14374 TaxID=3237007 RepID=UPI0034CF10CB
MPTLFLGNADTDAMVNNPRSLSKLYRQSSARASRRHLWMMSPGDAIILPSAGDDQHVHYVEESLQICSGSLHVFYVHGRSDDPYPMSLESLKNPEILHSLRKIGVHGKEWSIEPYIADDVAFDFGKLIDVPVRFGRFGTPTREVADLFNDKRVFRALAAGLHVPIANGRTCGSQAQLASALREITPLSGASIVKLDRHSGAEGNVLVAADDITSAPGAQKVFRVSDSRQYNSVAHQVYTELSRGHTPFFVVESYRRSVHSVGIHYLLSENSVDFNGIADIRLAPAYSGMFWPTVLPEAVVHKLLAEAQKLANDIARFGHRGPVSIDAIVDLNGEIMVNEVNARHGGFSAAKAIIDRVRGRCLMSTPFVAATRGNLSCDVDFESLCSLLEREGLSFTQSTGAGILIPVEDLRNSGRIEILTIAASRTELERLEDRFVQLVCR